MRRVRLFVGFLGSALLLSAGCAGGDGTAEVSGSVLIDGAPAPANTRITFRPADGVKTPAGAEVVDGKYTVRVAVGKSMLEVRASRQSGERKLGAKGGPTAPVFNEILPDEYHNKTKLSYDVVPGKQVHDLNLQSKK